MNSPSVLIVDDDQIVALHIKDQLMRLGYRVLAMAASGVEALRCISEQRPDVILMDIDIAGEFDGIETCRRIPGDQQRPVIYMTAYTEEPTLERARETRPYGYLLKPFFERELHATIQMALERWRADCVLRDSQQQMSDLISVRTEALAAANRKIDEQLAERLKIERTLWQVQKMEAIGHLTSGIAHDFNNLLAVLQGGLEFVEKSSADGVTADPELVDVMLRVTKRGRSLVRRLLTFGRETESNLEPVVVDQVVLDSLRLLQRLLGRNIEIVTKLGAKAATVSADSNQLAHVLLNLALNARDAMPDGGQMTITTTVQAAGWVADGEAKRWTTGEEVCVAVADTGTGMSDEVRRRIFEPFFTTKQDGGAAGLGLTMAHRFAEQCGGRINVDSKIKRGTTVSLHLPCIERAVPASEPRASTEPLAGVDGRKTVLLVEDDPDLRLVMSAQMQELGYTVHAVTNGDEAISVIESPSTIDVLVTDIILPGGTDGVSVIKDAIQVRPDLAVLCISGFDLNQSDRKWLRVQNIELLEKPFSFEQLADALGAILLK
jgi:signal transduction histidine kinase